MGDPLAGLSRLHVSGPAQLSAGLRTWRPQATESVAARNATVHRSDQVAFSPDSQALYRLLRVWGSVAGLFGLSGAEPFDASALQKALQDAREQTAQVRHRQTVLDTLKNSAMGQAEALVEKYYGLQGDGAPLRVVLEEGMDGALASVRYTYDQQGRMANLQLHLDAAQFRPDAGPNGTNGHLIENDRIVAHEMTHAVMGRNIDMRYLPDWFAEGTAEYIAGGAERLGIALRRLTAQQLMQRLERPWEGDTTQYAAAFVAVRQLDLATAESGGLKGIMARLKDGSTLDEAIAGASGGRYASARDFIQQTIRSGEGAALILKQDLSGRSAGSIKPGSGPQVVADTGGSRVQGFRVQLPSPAEGLLTSPSPWAFGLTQSGAVAAYQRQSAMRST